MPVREPVFPGGADSGSPDEVVVRVADGPVSTPMARCPESSERSRRWRPDVVASMLFLTHLLAAAVLARVRDLPPLWAVAGAALPDVVDKPLAMVGVTDLYHSVGHSLLVALLVPVALRYGPRGVALALGWASHVALDALHVVVNGRPTDALFALWPVVVPPTPLGIPPGSFFFYYLWSPSFFLEVGLWLAVGVVFVRRRRDASSG